MLRRLFYVLFLLLLIGGAAAAGFATWGYFYITRDLPHLTTVEDYQPPAVSKVFAGDGTLVAEFYKQRRYPLRIEEVPEQIRNCFLAAEDASFFKHKGIDFLSILRAFWKNLESGSARQGGSTITQQVVKNLLLSSEKKLKRKIKEALLSYQLEKRFTKEEILGIYLNQIFFGNTAYGLKAAARLYFHKEMSQLTLAEGAMLAGLPKAPSNLSPLTNMRRAKTRQKYVLDQMVKHGFASPEDAEAALREKIRVYHANPNNIYAAPFFVSEVRRMLLEDPRWRQFDIDTDGLEIYTTLDLKADTFATAALRKGLREIDKRRGWRGPTGHIDQADTARFRELYGGTREGLYTNTVYPALVTEAVRGRNQFKIMVADLAATLEFKDLQWAKRRLDKEDKVTWIKPEEVIKVGDVIEVSVAEPAPKNPKEPPAVMSGIPEAVSAPEKAQFVLDQTPEIEGSLILLDPHSGRVLVTVGGYSYQRSQFNRVTQSLRQPGSAFKPVIYLTAIDGFHYTPSTIVYDQPRTFRVGNEFWTPGNFDNSYMGAITLRTALEHSRNLVSADIISRIGIDPVIQYAKKLGIASKLGRNLSLSLGSSEVTMLELARVYGVFAAKGVLFDSYFVSKIVDRNGRVVFDAESEKLNRVHQVIPETSAFLMANLMKGVVEHGTGYRVKEIKRPVAGKTGTSNDQMDTWFIGYTPSWVTGVWVGFDVKKEIGPKETGGRVAAPVWLYFMHDYLNYLDQAEYARLVEEAKGEAQRLGIEYTPPGPLTPLDFSVPDGVEPFWVDKTTGLLSDSGNPNAISEYFIKGTEPSNSTDTEATTSYLESPEL